MPSKFVNISSRSFDLNVFPVGLLGDGMSIILDLGFNMASTSSWKSSVRSTKLVFPPFTDIK